MAKRTSSPAAVTFRRFWAGTVTEYDFLVGKNRSEIRPLSSLCCSLFKIWTRSPIWTGAADVDLLFRIKSNFPLSFRVSQIVTRSSWKITGRDTGTVERETLRPIDVQRDHLIANGLLCSHNFAEIKVACYDAQKTIYYDLLLRFGNIFVVALCRNRPQFIPWSDRKSLNSLLAKASSNCMGSGAQSGDIQWEFRTPIAGFLPMSGTAVLAEYLAVASTRWQMPRLTRRNWSVHTTLLKDRLMDLSETLRVCLGSWD